MTSREALNRTPAQSRKLPEIGAGGATGSNRGKSPLLLTNRLVNSRGSHHVANKQATFNQTAFGSVGFGSSGRNQFHSLAPSSIT